MVRVIDTNQIAQAAQDVAAVKSSFGGYWPAITVGAMWFVRELHNLGAAGGIKNVARYIWRGPDSTQPKGN